ncbi:segregation/condensation protein A [Leptolyngbya sp. 'hensonii']|uniref:segregation/condensation protein A n=1 Tax=Leptolyngbya sp. 'hensonii' TaxID=1922337 RepID=UPI00094F66D8|nr:ScpA family protein [Leptolyngbya sp. 'hensonii']OLP17916.1 segregation/condensation protein A [Leptolyngbya sp. 'hensonii']
MTESLAQNAIALLIDLAEQGEIDPWDVKVIDVIDRFLNQLRTSTSVATGRATYEADLSQSGQAFLYASMLILLKADSLARSESGEPEADALAGAELLESEELSLTQMPLHLDRQLRRRAVAQPPQQRRVTLQELIDQLQLIAVAMEETVPRVRPRRPRPQSRSQAVRAIAQLAHQENLTEVAMELEQFLSEQWGQISSGQDWIVFEELLQVWSGTRRTINLRGAPGHSETQHRISERVSIFWALLFLAAQSKVELSQAGFYQDLAIRPLNDTTTQTCSEVE